jgi:tetratricopeptide (TPR) repeat protein
MLLGFFVAGFLAGIVFSAWKLDSNVGQGQAFFTGGGEHDQQAALRTRIAELEKRLASKPEDVDVLVQLGNDYFDLGHYAKAVGVYEKAVQIDPRNADVITDMGIGYRKLGKPEESVRAFQKALDANPEHSMALFNLGIVLRDDLKDNVGALKAWELFLKKAGDTPHAVMIRPWVKQLREKIGSGSIGGGTQ